MSAAGIGAPDGRGGTAGDPMGSTAELVALAADLRRDWQAAGVIGGLLVRHLDTGAEVGFDVDRRLPLASVVKVPIALVLYDLIETGALDPTRRLELSPELRCPGSTGIALFTEPCSVAVTDLITLMLTISDNAATDALMELVAPDAVTAQLHAWGFHELQVRHRIRELHDSIARLPESTRGHLLELAVHASTRGGGHAIPQLDTSHANVGTATSLVALLEAVWTDRVSVPTATARLRATMARQITTRRIGAELVSDLTRVAGKTGSFLNLRHEIGVVETADGDRLAVAALTASSIPAGEQPEVDAAIGSAARIAVEAMT